jgi:hypothetical protein
MKFTFGKQEFPLQCRPVTPERRLYCPKFQMTMREFTKVLDKHSNYCLNKTRMTATGQFLSAYKATYRNIAWQQCSQQFHCLMLSLQQFHLIRLNKKRLVL